MSRTGTPGGATSFLALVRNAFERITHPPSAVKEANSRDVSEPVSATRNLCREPTGEIILTVEHELDKKSY